jgi:hypothetical protein
LVRRVAKKKKAAKRFEFDLAEYRYQQEQIARLNVSMLSGWRLEEFLTQADIGEALGVSEDVVYAMEALKRPVSLEQSIVWAHRTGRDFGEYQDELRWKLRKLFPKKSS